MGIKLGKDIQKKNSEIKDCHHQTTSFIAKGVRTAFVIFGIVYVMYGFIKSMQKFQEGNVNIKEEVISQKKYRYPSVTFCYKYKHGTKDVLHNYYPDLYEKWKNSGKHLCTSHLIFTKIIPDTYTLYIHISQNALWIICTDQEMISDLSTISGATMSVEIDVLKTTSATPGHTWKERVT